MVSSELVLGIPIERGRNTKRLLCKCPNHKQSTAPAPSFSLRGETLPFSFTEAREADPLHWAQESRPGEPHRPHPQFTVSALFPVSLLPLLSFISKIVAILKYTTWGALGHETVSHTSRGAFLGPPGDRGQGVPRSRLLLAFAGTPGRGTQSGSGSWHCLLLHSAPRGRSTF